MFFLRTKLEGKTFFQRKLLENEKNCQRQKLLKMMTSRLNVGQLWPMTAVNSIIFVYQFPHLSFKPLLKPKTYITELYYITFIVL